MSQGWEALVGTALLGTSRKPLDVAAFPPAVASHLSPEAGTDSAARLLDAAGLMVLYERAGAVAAPPPAHAGTMTAAPPSDGRALPPAAVARLADLLRGVGTNTLGMLRIWLDAAGAAGFDAPPESVPELLNLALVRPELDASIRAVLGARGRWLATQRRDWRAWLDPGQPTRGLADVDVWTHGVPAQRQAWFSAVRERDPATARGLLLALDWAAQDGASRLAFVTTLASGLAPEDEPLLERARSDRRKDVRLAAAGLLARLPGSAYLQQLTDLAGDALAIRRVRFREQVVVTLPEPTGESRQIEFAVPKWLRDRPEHSPRAALLWYLTSVVPLEVWEARLGVAPADLVKLPVGDDLAFVVHSGWDDAAVQQGNAPWALALMGWRDPASMGPLLLALPSDRRQNVVTAALKRDQSGPRAISFTTAESILASCPPPWSAGFTAALLAWLARESRANNIWGAFPLLARLGHSLPSDPQTEATVRAVARQHPVNSSWYPALAEVAATLLYRRQMLEELR